MKQTIEWTRYYSDDTHPNNCIRNMNNMHCKCCGTEITEKRNVCPNCGTELEYKNSIVKTFVKGFFYSLGILFVIAFVGAWTAGVADNTDNQGTPVVVTTPTPEPSSEPTTDSDIRSFVNIYKDGQNDIVECKHLSVSGNNNDIQITNKDVERITVLGHGNSISYSYDADPKIKDYGNYNDVWQRWLT